MSASWCRNAAFSSLTLLASYAHHHSPQSQHEMRFVKFWRSQAPGGSGGVHAVSNCACCADNSWYLVRRMKSWVGVRQHTCLAQQKQIVKAHACVPSTLHPPKNVMHESWAEL